eukprot:CAMPEP_0204571656 /NCGR_PEP_ID=MMETSP0661-20131031/39014_1 /ASSEMBLY_ACC=CAM_ASM_000606 /TAXON_ID=109239 /ORGANISM="Alexandrium margalefi, Strain AMGDE01CS-322" /LENGTH=42 /DNA_ID= /DNA_START= /DNA_END= /DNA_ORIENTATION=
MPTSTDTLVGLGSESKEQHLPPPAHSARVGAGKGHEGVTRAG